MTSSEPRMTSVLNKSTDDPVFTSDCRRSFSIPVIMPSVFSLCLLPMILSCSQKKQKQVDPEKFNMRIVEDNLTEVEPLQFVLAMIIDEEQLRKRQTDQQMKLG